MRPLLLRPAPRWVACLTVRHTGRSEFFLLGGCRTNPEKDSKRDNAKVCDFSSRVEDIDTVTILNFRINHLTERSGRAARRVTQYLQREGVYAPAEVGYVLRTTTDTAERGDYVTQTQGNLPAWAEEDAGRFFAQAEALERGGAHRAGRWATTWQIALPKELTRAEQWEMGKAFVETHLARHAYLCVMHDPVKDGHHQPHIHVLFSERIHDARVLDAATYFRRPEVGGCAKDRWFSQRGTAYALREAWADWTNYTLEHAGHPERVHPRSLQARDMDRKPEPKVGYSTDPEVHEAQATIRAQRNEAKEQAQAADGWEARKQRLGVEEVREHDPMDFLRGTHERTRHQEVGRWNPALAQLKAERSIAHSQRLDTARHAEAQQLQADLAILERQAAVLHAARLGEHVPAPQLVSALAASHRESAPRRGLHMHLYDKEQGHGW